MKKCVCNKDIWIACIVDESGSMETCRQQVIDGFNEYLADRRKEVKDGFNERLWLTKFNSTPKLIVNGEKIENIKDLNRETYNPNGWTALYDAIGITIKDIEAKLSKRKNKPRILVLIITDGQENSSKEFSHRQIRELILSKEKEGNWTFAYLGANQDAWAVGGSLGISPNNNANFIVAAAGATFNKMSNSTARYVSLNDNTTTFYSDS